MAKGLSSEQIKTVLSEIWRARELKEDYGDEMAFLAEKLQFPDLEEYLEEALFPGDLPLAHVAARLAAFEPVKRRLSREELVAAVRRIVEDDGDPAELEELIDVVQANVPHPAVADLIYWPPDGQDLSPEEIVARALEYIPPGE